MATRAGLRQRVVLGGPGYFKVLRIPWAVDELIAVSDTHHVRPLRRFLQAGDRYQILQLSLDKIRLFEGNRHALDEIDLAPCVPRTIAEALGAELTEPHQTVASHGGVGGGKPRMHHGHGAKADEADSDADRFFRAVDRAVTEQHSKPSGLPLILSALPEHHHLFRKVSRNPFLLDDGIKCSPNALTIDDLCALAWQVVEPRYQAQLASLRDEFNQASSRGAGSDHLGDVAHAAADGRVRTLLLDANCQIAGHLDAATGGVDLLEPPEPQTDELLDALGALVKKQGGTVLVVPGTEMPRGTGLAAIYRY